MNMSDATGHVNGTVPEAVRLLSSHAKEEPEAVAHAINSLNAMILEAQNKYADLHWTCHSTINRLAISRDQGKRDMDRFQLLSGEHLGIFNTFLDLVQQTDGKLADMDSRKFASDQQQKADLEEAQTQLRRAERDYEVGLFILNWTKYDCHNSDESTSLMQRKRTALQVCHGSGPNVSFKDRVLQQKLSMLSGEARALFNGLLARDTAGSRGPYLDDGDVEGNAAEEDRDNAGTEEEAQAQRGVRIHKQGASEVLVAAGKEETDEVPQETAQGSDASLLQMAGHGQQRARAAPPATAGDAKNLEEALCGSVEPDCDVLHDNVSPIWGQLKDTLEYRRDRLAHLTEFYEELHRQYVDARGLLVEQRQDYESHKNDGFTRHTESDEGRVAMEKVWQQFSKEHDQEVEKCDTEKDHTFSTELCGTTKVRNALLHQYGLELGADCIMGEWHEGTCPVSCDDSGVGDRQTATRSRVVAQSGHGAECPINAFTFDCGRNKCAVDCVLGNFGPYTQCTADCGGGFETRVRAISTHPLNGGDVCETLSETQSCNMGSCATDCEYEEWSDWSDCNPGCEWQIPSWGGFYQTRNRFIKTHPTNGGAACAGWHSDTRHEFKSCEQKRCYGDEVCQDRLDVVVALDASGSLTRLGFDVVKRFAKTFLEKFANSTDKRWHLIGFGNGELDSSGTVSSAEVLLENEVNVATVIQAVEGMEWRKGFSNLAQAALAAKPLLAQGNGQHKPVVVFITDGYPSYYRDTNYAMFELRETAKVAIAVLNGNLPYLQRSWLHWWARDYFRLWPYRYVRMAKRRLNGTTIGDEHDTPRYGELANMLLSKVCSGTTSLMRDQAAQSLQYVDEGMDHLPADR